MEPVNASDVVIQAPGVSLPGRLSVPADAAGLVIFAHGSGSSRLSPRNIQVAETLHSRRMATLLFDLLTPEEDESYANRFDIDLLSKRLMAAAYGTAAPEVPELPLGLFGASTGGAAALVAAANMCEEVRAVVSRGGRPDLAMNWLPRVCSPTLLIVGGYDRQVIDLNQIALEQIHAEKRLDIVPKATHLFEEPGALEQVSSLAADWFEEHLPR